MENNKLVWAKLGRWPHWPAKTVDVPPKIRKKQPSNTICVLFWGTNNFGFIKPTNIEPYAENRDKFANRCKKPDFLQAVKEMDEHVGDPSNDQYSASDVDFTDGKVKVKIEEDSDSEEIIEFNANEVSRNDRLMTELLALRSKHAETVYELQKSKESLINLQNEKQLLLKQIENNTKLISSLELDGKNMSTLLHESQDKVQSLQKVNDDLIVKLADTQTKLKNQKQSNVKAILTTKAKEQQARDLKKEKSILSARLTQIQRGVQLNNSFGKGEANVPLSDDSKGVKRDKTSRKRKANAPTSDDSEMCEVSKLVDHQCIKSKWQFLVRWKSFGKSHDSWVAESDLNCPQILNAYKKAKKLK